MYTHATRHFGIWRDTHASRSRYGGPPAAGLIMGLATCAFVGWLIFFLSLKIRTDYFLLENSGLRLAKVKATDPVYFKQRPAAVSLGVVKLGPNRFRFLFDSGEVLEFPAQRDKLSGVLRKKTQDIVTLALLTKSHETALGRVQIWPDVSVGFDELRFIMNALSEFGFDDFDFAFEAE